MVLETQAEFRRRQVKNEIYATFVFPFLRYFLKFIKVLLIIAPAYESS